MSVAHCVLQVTDSRRKTSFGACLLCDRGWPRPCNVVTLKLQAAPEGQVTPRSAVWLPRLGQVGDVSKKQESHGLGPTPQPVLALATRYARGELPAQKGPQVMWWQRSTQPDSTAVFQPLQPGRAAKMQTHGGAQPCLPAGSNHNSIRAPRLPVQEHAGPAVGTKSETAIRLHCILSSQCRGG